MNAPARPNPDVQDRAAITAFVAAQDLDLPSGYAGPGLAEEIRRLQTLHPEKQGGDASAWDAGLARIRTALAGKS